MPHQTLPKDLQEIVLGYFDLNDVEKEIKSNKYQGSTTTMSFRECLITAHCLNLNSSCCPKKDDESCSYTFLRKFLFVLSCPLSHAQASSLCIPHNAKVSCNNYKDTRLARFFIDLERTEEPARQIMQDQGRNDMDGYRELP